MISTNMKEGILILSTAYRWICYTTVLEMSNELDSQ